MLDFRHFPRYPNAEERIVSMTLEELEAEAEKLPLEERVLLAEHLMAALPRGEDWKRLWGEESQRRLKEYKEGRVKGVSGEKVLAEGRKIVDEKFRVSASDGFPNIPRFAFLI